MLGSVDFVFFDVCSNGVAGLVYCFLISLFAALLGAFLLLPLSLSLFTLIVLCV